MKYLDIDKIESHPLTAQVKDFYMRKSEVFRKNLRRESLIWQQRLKHPRTWIMMIGAGLAFLLIVALGTYITFANDLGSKQKIVNAKNTGTIVYDRNGKTLFATAGAHDLHYVTIDQMPQSLKNATVAIEDKEFYKEGGFSFSAIFRSIYADVATGDPTRYGGSTITQQLVRTAFLSQNKNFIRKFQELVLSIEITRRFSKDEILEMYLNSVYYGAGAYGIENASQTYFGKDVHDLDLAQSSLLAGLPNAPSYLSPTAGGDAAAAKTRQGDVLTKMATLGYISSSEATAAKAETLKYLPFHQDIAAAPHFSIYILDKLKEKYGEDYIGRAGLRVTTTLDLDLQQKAEKILASRVKALAGNNVTNGGLVSIDPTNGQVIAMVGSADYENDSIGGKVNISFAERQPGSSIKPIVYLKALEEKQITAATTLHDVPTDFYGYKPTDFDLQYRGSLPARYALAQSLNIPAVEVLNKIGVPSALEMAHRLKISTLQDTSRYGLSLVLGGGEVQLFELTRAYGVMANYGNYVDTQPFLKIVDREGNTVYEAPSPRPQNLVDPQFTYVVSDVLADQNAKLPTYGAGGVASLSIPGHKAAVKTGTTENFRDAWTVGYTPNLVTGVWVGNNDGSYMDSVAGSLGAAPIWRDFMAQAEAKMGWQDFRVPGGIQRARVCYGNGLLSSTDYQSYLEVFASGTLPKGQCNVTPPPSPESTNSATTSGDQGKKDTNGGNPPVATPPGHPPPLP